MTHYIAILVAAESGQWRALFPDVPECKAYGYGVLGTKQAAAISLNQHAKTSGALPLPRTLEEIEKDEDWLIRNGVNFAKAIVTIVPWPGDPSPKTQGNA
jgi:predicted RNase H-like HicB family nuclease